MVWILVSLMVVGVLALLLGIIAYKKDWKKQKGSDYYTFFVMGMVWLIFGAALNLLDYDGMGFFVWLGLVWFVLGIHHFQNWRTDKKDARVLSGWIRKLPKGAGYLIGLLLGVLLLWPMIRDHLGFIGLGLVVGLGIGLAIEKGIHGKPPKEKEPSKRMMTFLAIMVALGVVAIIALILVLGP